MWGEILGLSNHFSADLQKATYPVVGSASLVNLVDIILTEGITKSSAEIRE